MVEQWLSGWSAWEFDSGQLLGHIVAEIHSRESHTRVLESDKATPRMQRVNHNPVAAASAVSQRGAHMAQQLEPEGKLPKYWLVPGSFPGLGLLKMFCQSSATERHCQCCIIFSQGKNLRFTVRGYQRHLPKLPFEVAS